MVIYIIYSGFSHEEHGDCPYVNVCQRVSMEIWGFFDGINIYIWNYVCFEWKYQGNQQIMEISMDIYGNINGMNGNIQRHQGDIYHENILWGFLGIV